MAAFPRRAGVKIFDENLSANDNLQKKTTKTTANVPKAVAIRPVFRDLANVQRRPPMKREVSKGKVAVNNKPDEVEKDQQRKLKETISTLVEVKEILKSGVDVYEDVHVDIHEDIHIDVTDIKDIDEDDTDNLTLCAEYVKDIYTYLHKNEKRLMPSDYMRQQGEVSEKMRTILVDWLIQVHTKFNLLQETLYLTVYIIDRFLAKSQIKRTELQLVGVTAMWLASKYEEMYAPEVRDFVYITDNAYSSEKIKSMEQKMLKICEYDFSNALCLQFLRRNSKAGEVNAEKHTLAKYFMELTLISYKFTLKYPSQIAAAALYLSIKVIDSSEWTPTLHYYSRYSEEDIKPIVCEMASLVLSMEGTKYESVKVKYSASRFLKISRIPELKGITIKRYAAAAVTTSTTDD